MRRFLLIGLIVAGALLGACASGGSSEPRARGNDPYYRGGTIHSDTYPGTYGRAGVGRPGRYRRY